MKIYYNNFIMDWSTGTVFIKATPLIKYICLKYMSEILIITERMNDMIKSIAYKHSAYKDWENYKV